ncbi:MAG: DNA cytosine methyltransferase, partial [Acidimicrobiia bacterium]
MQPLPVVSLFSGTGGLDLAAETLTSSVESPIRDGVAQVRVSVEWGDEECDTLRANFDGPVVQGDITQLSAAEILDIGG